MKILNKQKGMVSAIVIMSVGLFSLTAAILTLTGGVKGLKKDRDLLYGSYSFYTAEAAAKEGIYQYLNTPTYSGGDAPLLNHTDQATATVNTLDWPEIEVTGAGSGSGYHREVVYTVNTFPESLAFQYAVYSQNKLNFTGNAQVNNGNIFAINEIDLAGSSQIDGDAFSSTKIDDKNEKYITGNLFSYSDPVLPPTIDIDSYRLEAESDGTFFNNSSDAEDYLKNEDREAVVFVESSTLTHIQKTNLEGAFIVKGDLTLNGGTISAAEGYPALYVEGNLRIEGGTEINGIVYVKGSTTFGLGGGTINGSLISTGDVSQTEILGTATINFDESLLEDWKDLKLEPSDQDPIITGWGEN